MRMQSAYSELPGGSMRRNLQYFLVAMALFFGLASHIAAQSIKLVQHGSTDNGSTSATTVVVTLSNVNAGDLLTCSLSFGAASAVSLSVADNVNGAWSVANAAHFDSANTQITGQFYLANSKAGTTTITGTVGVANADGAINCQEWSGAATSNPLDQATQQDGTTANASSGSITTAVAGELILGDLENIGSPTAGVGFTLLNSTPYTEISTEYQLQTSAGAIAATWTSSAGNWTAQVATFKPAPVSGSINLVQHGTTDNGGSSSTVVLTLNGVTAGDLLTCSLSFGASSAITLSVADNVNGAWLVANAAHFDSANTQATGEFYFANSKSGNITITGTAGTAGAPQAINCQEWSGAATSSPLDQDAQQDGTVANASSGSITTTVAGELILGDLENIQTPTAGSGFTLINTTAQTWLSTEYQIQTNAGSVAATWTSIAGPWTAQVATFKPASGGGGAPPTITSFSPPSGVVGTSVTITGTNFTGATATKFNGTSATSFTVNSSTQITATVPTGATTGTISVTTPYGTATTSTSFTVNVPAPTITTFSPTSGTPGTSVTITGTNFTGATAVAFHGTAAASFTVNSATQITATVPNGATTGTITVTTPGGTATSSTSFTVNVPAPTITTFSPTSGTPGTSVTITGTNFTGSTAVAFHGTAAASFTVNSATQITATVPNGATTGTITVTTPGGTATSSTSFTVNVPAPTITTFSPTSGTPGTSVTITGTNFTGATAVAFHGTAAASFTVNSSTQITATVPTSASTGAITATTPGGTATSPTSFTFIPPGPSVYYYLEDSLGTSRVITNNTGVVCYDADFYPFGGEVDYTNTCPQNYKFEGKERDTETNNDEFGARYYSWRFGRWLSSDWSAVPVAVPYANLTNPQTLNLYSMVADDPESFADLDGHVAGEWVDPKRAPMPEVGDGSDWAQGYPSKDPNQANQSAQQQLSVADVTKIIQQAQKSGGDPVSTGMQIFNGLGSNASVTGDTLRQAIKESKVDLGGAAADLIQHADSISKSGSNVTITNSSAFSSKQGDVTINFAKTVSFSVGADNKTGLPGFSQIQGLSGKQGKLGADVTKIQVVQRGDARKARLDLSIPFVHPEIPLQ
jgi:RHS repeat-associated protein